jgi:hypothetical protein
MAQFGLFVFVTVLLLEFGIQERSYIEWDISYDPNLWYSVSRKHIKIKRPVSHNSAFHRELLIPFLFSKYRVRPAECQVGGRVRGGFDIESEVKVGLLGFPSNWFDNIPDCIAQFKSSGVLDFHCGENSVLRLSLLIPGPPQFYHRGTTRDEQFCLRFSSSRGPI